MIDQFGRCIDYMRISITDQCNLRCRYCTSDGLRFAQHCDILSYEEILRICSLAVTLGIVKFKITGGEPLVRKGCADFIARLKALPNVQQVTITTNGLLLSNNLDDLCAAGIDGVNISLDTLSDTEYRKLTGHQGEAIPIINQVLVECVKRNIRVKVNAVLLAETLDSLPGIAALAAELPIDVRFIEMMPIGKGKEMEGITAEAALHHLKKYWPDMRSIEGKRGNGPACYYTAAGLEGYIGFIGAMSSKFCGGCNRVRLIATGILKPCLCYDTGFNLRMLLRDGCSDEEILSVIQNCVHQKPYAHCFERLKGITEQENMNRIGG